MIRLSDKDCHVLNPGMLEKMGIYTINIDGDMASELINEGDASVRAKRVGSEERIQVARRGDRIILHCKDSVTIVDPRDHEKKYECIVEMY